jgi:hypothetical protein
VTGLRLLAGGAVAVALAGFTAGFLNVEAERAAAAPPAASPTATAPPPPKLSEPLPPAVVPRAARARVPAAILARAANARALERGPACPPADRSPAPEGPPRCAPEQREAIEIEWHVAPNHP